MQKLRHFIAAAVVLVPPSYSAMAEETEAEVHRISADGIGESIGTITLRDGAHGMAVNPDLRGLPPGNHAFHIHVNPNCEPGVKDGRKVAGLKAGGHYDPMGATHGSGHSSGMKSMKPHGDLPQLFADFDGTATKPVVTAKLNVAQVRGRAIMIHRYGESDPGKPKGGGPRYACGVIPN